MKSKGKKKEELDALKKELSEAKNLFVAQFQGMTVAQDAELRHKVRDTKSKYRVVKNTLAKKAAEGTAAESVSKSFDGSTAIAYNASDPVSLAKALTAYAKANPLFVFKAGLVEGDAFEGRAHRKIVVFNQCAGTTNRYRREWCRSQSGCGAETGRRAKEISRLGT